MNEFLADILNPDWQADWGPVGHRQTQATYCNKEWGKRTLTLLVLHLLTLADSWSPDGWAGPSDHGLCLSPARCRDHLLLIGGQAWSPGPLRQSQASWGQVWPIRGQHQSTSLHSISNFMPVDIRSKITRNTCLYKQDISPWYGPGMREARRTYHYLI